MDAGFGALHDAVGVAQAADDEARKILHKLEYILFHHCLCFKFLNLIDQTQSCGRRNQAGCR